MRFKSAVFTAASGSVGGLTYSHNAGGMYVRARAIPTNRGTVYQQAVRIAVAGLVNGWTNLLSSDQRTAWDDYGANVALLDVFGDPRFRSGISHYVRSNVPLVAAGVASIDDAPGVYNVGEYAPGAMTAASGEQVVLKSFTPSDDWVNEDGARMLVYIGRPQNPSINYFKGPYRRVGTIDGSSTTPPDNPAIFPSPFIISEGQRVFWRANVSRADGRLSTSATGFCPVTAG